MDHTLPRDVAGVPMIDESARNRIAALVEAAGIPGCSIAAWREGRTATLECGYAELSSRRAVQPTTVFHLFSGTKLYTAAALMLLVERGQVDLDAPLRTYLGEVRLRHSVSLRQLASHCSGLPDTLSGFLAIHFRGAPMPTAAAARARYRIDKGRVPGRKAAYRNVNYALLGEVIARVAQKPFIELVETEIMTPLNSQAAFDYSDEMRARAAVGYITRFNPMRWLLRIMMPEVSRQLERPREGALVPLEEYALDTAAIGGLLGSATDFLPLVSEMLTPTDGLLSAASKREMLTVQSRGAAGIVSRVGVGIGWKCGRQGGVEFWNHEGGGAGFTSETRIYPHHGLGVVMLMNATQTPKLSRVAHDVCELLLRN